MIDRKAFQVLSSRIDSYVEDMVEMQYKLTSIPALSPENDGDGEFAKSRLLLSLLGDMGFKDIVEINVPDVRVSSAVRPNLFITLPGSNLQTSVWVLSHMDIVPPGEMKFWNADPYSAYVRDGRIFGRGTEDNQQDLIASIFAAKAFRDEGIQPATSIGLAFVSDEETASEKGLKYVLAHQNNPFRPEDIIIVPDSGNPEGTTIEIAEKSILWFRVETVGKQCHASRPVAGNNAFLAASHFCVRLDDLHKTFGISDDLYDIPTSTFQPTKKDANVPNINTIPGYDVFYMDCRILPIYALSEVLKEVRSFATNIETLFSVTIHISPIHQVQAPFPIPKNTPAVLALQEAILDVYRVHAHPIGVGAGTVASFLRTVGYPAVVWCKTLQTAHQPNEHCLIANMIGNTKVFAHLFLQQHCS